MDLIENALGASADGGGSGEDHVLARDSNAVVSTFWPEQRRIGALLANAEGGPSAACYALQVMCWAAGAMGANMFVGLAADLGPLAYIAAALYGFALGAYSLVVGSARQALHPGGRFTATSAVDNPMRTDNEEEPGGDKPAGGALEWLGAGHVMISASDARSNSRWRTGLGFFSAINVLYGSVTIVSHSLGLRVCPDQPGGVCPADVRIFNVMFGLLNCTLGPVLSSGWWASMRTASCLCRDATVEVIKATRNTDPADEEEWEEKVNRPALALRGKFELLSRGWAGGLAGLGGFCWLLALGAFALALRAVGQHMVAARVQFMAIAAGAALLPFPLAWDIAHTSSFCDLLVDELNEVRIRHGVACDAKITYLEVALGNLVRWPCIALPRAPAPAASMAVEVILVLPCSVYTFATYARRTEARASVLCLVGTSSTSAA